MIVTNDSTNHTNDLMLHCVIYHALLLTPTAFDIVSIKLYIVLQLTLIYYVSQCKMAFAGKGEIKKTVISGVFLAQHLLNAMRTAMRCAAVFS